MSELVIHQNTDLTLGEEQDGFSDAQRAALTHMGVSDAPEGDLQIFFHQCRRTGLDPFLRQVYMIGRESNIPPAQDGGQWRKETKYTIQTGIDGFRVIGHRAAAASKHTVALSAPEWAHPDGSWRPVWSKAWGNPVAAKVTITRNGQPFTAVALFDEYAQTKRGGQLTKMWEQRPGGQVAKCAEALAWRMSFPHDLSGVYIDEEMQHADAPLGADRSITPQVTTDDFTAPAYATVDADVVTGEVAEPKLSDEHRRKMFSTLTRKGCPEDRQAEFISQTIGRPVVHRDAITVEEYDAVIARLAGRDDKVTEEQS